MSTLIKEDSEVKLASHLHFLLLVCGRTLPGHPLTVAPVKGEVSWCLGIVGIAGCVWKEIHVPSSCVFHFFYCQLKTYFSESISSMSPHNSLIAHWHADITHQKWTNLWLIENQIIFLFPSLKVIQSWTELGWREALIHKSTFPSLHFCSANLCKMTMLGGS